MSPLNRKLALKYSQTDVALSMATILVLYILDKYFRHKGAKFLNIYDDALFHYPTTYCSVS